MEITKINENTYKIVETSEQDGHPTRIVTIVENTRIDAQINYHTVELAKWQQIKSLCEDLEGGDEE